MEKDSNYRILILSKLYRRDLWGKSYTTVENSLSKLPKHERGKGKEELEEMQKDGIVLFHKRENCVSLNPSAKEQIEDTLQGHLPDYLF